MIRKATVGGVQIAYQVLGQGPPLIMIMGLGANMDWWDPRLIQALSPRFRLILFDNRGAGRSEGSQGAYSVRLFGDDTAALMDALGVARAHVLGISMGGMIAQELALSYPDKVERLVLCSTFCGGHEAVRAKPEVLGVLASVPRSESREAGARLVASICFSKRFMEDHPDRIEFFLRQALIAPTSAEAFARQARAVLEFDSYDRLPRIRAPTLVLHGEEDVLIPPENGPILANAIPGARLVMLEKSAHGLSEQIEEVSELVTGFLLDRTTPTTTLHRA